MKRVIYELYGEGGMPSLHDLDSVKELMTAEERRSMDNRAKILMNIFGFKDIKDLALAEKFFSVGYLCAHTYEKKELE